MSRLSRNKPKAIKKSENGQNINVSQCNYAKETSQKVSKMKVSFKIPGSKSNLLHYTVILMMVAVTSKGVTIKVPS